MTHAIRLLAVVLLVGAGCSSRQAPAHEVVVGSRWREVKFQVLNREACTEITIQSSQYTDYGFVIFQLREGVKAVADSAMLTPQQMTELRTAMPNGTTLAGSDQLVLDGTTYTLTIDGQAVTASRSDADPSTVRVLDWFDAYAATLRHSATTRPWFK